MEYTEIQNPEAGSLGGLMFSSKEEFMEHDRFPYVSHTGSRHEFAGTFEGKPLTYEPRSPQKKTQNNATNPALVKLREILTGKSEDTCKTLVRIKYLAYECYIKEHETTWMQYTPEAYAYLKHAYKVLGRLNTLWED